MNKLIGFLVVLTLFASCEKEISIDIPQHTPLLVGNCLFESGRPLLVHVSNSLGSLDNAPLLGHDSAHVSLYEDGVFRELLFPVGEGFHGSILIPSPNKKYTLKIEESGYTSIESSDTAPDSLAFTASVTDSAYFDENQTPFAEVLIQFQDPTSEGNHYKINMSYVDTLNQGMVGPMENPIYMESEDPVVEKANIEDFLLSDATFNGRTYSLRIRINSNEYNYGAAVIVRLSAVSTAYYKYMKTAFINREGNGNPFAEPVIVYSNFENGRGVFAGSSTRVVRLR